MLVDSSSRRAFGWSFLMVLSILCLALATGVGIVFVAIGGGGGAGSAADGVESSSSGGVVGTSHVDVFRVPPIVSSACRSLLAQDLGGLLLGHLITHVMPQACDSILRVRSCQEPSSSTPPNTDQFLDYYCLHLARSASIVFTMLIC
jgi:hypothetical protein